MICSCGFKFSGPGEYRNCEAYVDNEGNSCIICPKCGTNYRPARDRTPVTKETQ